MTSQTRTEENGHCRVQTRWSIYTASVDNVDHRHSELHSHVNRDVWNSDKVENGYCGMQTRWNTHTVEHRHGGTQTRWNTDTVEHRHGGTLITRKI